jgi:hypothetical protein
MSVYARRGTLRNFFIFAGLSLKFTPNNILVRKRERKKNTEKVLKIPKLVDKTTIELYV